MKNEWEKEFSKYKDSSLFDREQLITIQGACINKLSPEQMELFAKPEFNGDQMCEIYGGIKNRLSCKQVKLYAKPEFNKSQMRQIRLGLEAGLSQKQIKLYVNPEFDGGQMNEIRQGFKAGLSQEQIKLYANPKFGFLEMIKLHHFVEEADIKQFQQIKESIDAGLSYQQFRKYMSIDISAECMRVYKDMYMLSVPERAIDFMLKNKFNYESLKFVKYHLKDNASLGILSDVIKEAADEKLPVDEMKELYYSMAADSICDVSANIDIRNVVSKCFSYDMPLKQIKFIADSTNAEIAKRKAIALLEYHPLEEVKGIFSNSDVFNDVKDKSISSDKNWFDDIEK